MEAATDDIKAATDDIICCLLRCLARWVLIEIENLELRQCPAAKSGTKSLHSDISDLVAAEEEPLELLQRPAANRGGKNLHSSVAYVVRVEKELLESSHRRGVGAFCMARARQSSRPVRVNPAIIANLGACLGRYIVNFEHFLCQIFVLNVPNRIQPRV